jgi:phage shock protein E
LSAKPKFSINYLVIPKNKKPIMFKLLASLFGSGNKEQLAQLVKEGALLVDVRSASEFAGGSVKNAVNIPLNTVEQNISKFKNNKSVVVFCQSGGRSAQAASILKRNNIENVVNGGGWRSVANIVG